MSNQRKKKFSYISSGQFHTFHQVNVGFDHCVLKGATRYPTSRNIAPITSLKDDTRYITSCRIFASIFMCNLLI